MAQERSEAGGRRLGSNPRLGAVDGIQSQSAAPPGALLLDLDGTLIDRDGAFAEYAKELAAGNGDILEDLLCADRLGWPGYGAAAHRAVPQVFGNADGAWEHLWQHLPSFVEPVPRVARLLAKLRQVCPLACVTGGGAVQRRKLAAAGLEQAFDGIFVSSELGVEKPDPRIFLAALEALGVAPQTAWMVGDDGPADIDGAIAAGLRTCWVRSARRPAGTPTREVDRTTEFLEELCSTPAR